MRAWMPATGDTLTIGDRVTLIARVAAPRGSRVSVALLRSDTAAVEVIDGPRVAAAADGTHAVGLRVAVWAVGEVPAPIVRATVVSPGGATRTLDFPLRVPHVRSVLPADSAGIEPRGPKDVVDLRRASSISWLFIALAALAMLVVAFAVARWLRRRRTGEVREENARAAALVELRRAGDAGWIARGELRALYIAVAGAVRGFAGHLSPRWGVELTTEELAREMADAGAPVGDVETISAVLRRADLVKFARYRPTAEQAADDLASARAWVERAASPDSPASSDDEAVRDAEVAA